jgi:phosphatidylglycerophosphate synthase
MQAVIAIPETSARMSAQEIRERMVRPICGIPLLTRTILTAARSGAGRILLICPGDLPEELAQHVMQRPLLERGVRIQVIRVNGFDPRVASSWKTLEPWLEDRFLWLPWNWVTNKNSLRDLPRVEARSADWTKPAYPTACELGGGHDYSEFSQRSQRGVAVTSPESVRRAERFLIAHSGKVLDGIHTSFNRRICRPFVRLLSHTSVTPNTVTFGGVIVAALSAIAFARGSYWYSVLGALLFYVAGLFDEMDGMLARIKFAESPRGTWLEGFADGLSYLLLFAGITVGLDRRYGKVAILMGVALLLGAILALITTSLQRRRATTPDRPNEYLGRFYELLEKDSGNRISRIVRQVQAFQRRGVIIYYVFLFTLVGALPLVFCLATLGAHLTWILTLYFNHRFFAQPLNIGPKRTVNTPKEAV